MRLSRMCLGVVLIAATALPARADGLDVTATQRTHTVPRWDVFEITFRHGRRYANPFWDVTVEVRFTAPSGKEATVGGFHYGSDEKPDITVRKDDRGRLIPPRPPR